MLRRRKRIQFDPPGRHPRRKKTATPKRADQIQLNRRMFMLKGIAVGAFGVLVSRLGYMQILQGTRYTEQAESNVVEWNEVKPTRGLIFDRVGRPLAENRRTWAVRIIPTQLPPKDSDDWQRVRNTLITALHLPECLIIDPDAVPVDAQVTVFSRVGRLLGDQTDEDVQGTIDYIRRQGKINYVVLVDKNLTPDLSARIKSVQQELPGVEIVNYLDYLARNYRYLRTPVTVKGDVSKEVALKLEANLLYLPGVVLDDSVLVRHYPGGPVMSHILGYVGIIDSVDLDRESNIARVDPDGTKYYRFYKPDDIIGKNGLERYMEEILRGQKGGYFFEKDAYGVEQRSISSGSSPAVPGRNIQLTIDLELQAAISKRLSEGVAFSNVDRRQRFPEKTADCRGGAVVVTDPRNGEVLAMVSYPQYDNQLFIDGLSQRKLDEYLDPRSNQPLNDRAYAGSFAPGSVLKLFVALGALQEGVCNESTKFLCTGSMQVPWSWDETQGNFYRCWIDNLGAGHGAVDVVEALERSCDIYFYNIGTPKQRPEGAAQDLHYRDYYRTEDRLGELHYFNGLGIRRMHDGLANNFWFGEPTRIELPGEATGLVPTPEWKLKTFNDGWSSGDTINTSIGQGFFLASPLQLSVNTAALANGGTIHRPTIIRGLVDDRVQILQTFPTETLRVPNINGYHLSLIQEGMRRVIHSETGTANRSYNVETGEYTTKWPLTNPPGEEQILIAGKTGTAEVGVANEDGTYDESHAWFTCYAPADNPEVVITVFLERGGEGASYAVPIADTTLRAYFELTGRRKRGMVLREDGQPVNTVEAEADPATPEAGPSDEEPQQSSEAVG